MPLNLVCDKGELQDKCRSIASFTSPLENSDQHLRTLLIEPDMEANVVHVTAQSNETAGHNSTEKGAVDILDDDPIMVNPAYLMRAMNAIPDGRITLETKGRLLHITAGSGHPEVTIPIIEVKDDPSFLRPRINGYSEDAIIVRGADLRGAYSTAMQAIDITAKEKSMGDVLLENVGQDENGMSRLRLGAIQPSHAVIWKTIEANGGEDIRVLLSTRGEGTNFGAMLDRFKEYEVIAIHWDVNAAGNENRRVVHLVGYNRTNADAQKGRRKKGEDEKAEPGIPSMDDLASGDWEMGLHASVPMSANPIDQHYLAIPKVAAQINSYVQTAVESDSLLVDYRQFFDSVNNASAISSLNISGEQSVVSVECDDEGMRVAAIGDSSYDNTIDIIGDAPDMAFKIMWGVFSGFFYTCPENEDGTIRLNVIMGTNKSGVQGPRAIVLMSEESWKTLRDGGKSSLPADYFAMIPVKAIAVGE